MAERDEFDLIATYFAPLTAGASGAFDLTDDAAVLPGPPGEDWVVTTDTLVAGVHFLPDDPPADIARKALRVNLSDLAAMGAVAYGYTLAAALPAQTPEAWIAAFTGGLASDQQLFDVHLLGGDTVATPGPLALSVTAFGKVGRGQALRRSTARGGDAVYVTGTIGDAALGLDVARGGLGFLPSADRGWLLSRYRLPMPQVRFGPALVGLASAALDISDGLLADIGHLCRRSGVGAEVDLARIPLSAAATEALSGEAACLDRIAGGGDDYELAFTVPDDREADLVGLAASMGIAVTPIGRTRSAPGIEVRDLDGRPFVPDGSGYRHF